MLAITIKRMPKWLGGTILTAIFVGLVWLGIDMILHPSRHTNYHLRSGGEMRRELNEMQIQFLGVGLICLLGWVAYSMLTD